MNHGIVASRYAKALLKFSLELKQEEEVYEEMQQLLFAFRLPDFSSFLIAPTIALQQKKELMVQALGGDISEASKQFLKLIVHNNRIGLLKFIASCYITLYREQKKITFAKLITAVPAREETVDRIKKVVYQQTQKKVDLQTEVNKNILGGFVLEYDSYSLDASLSTKLKQIRKGLQKTNNIQIK